MKNTAIARVFEDIAGLLELKGENVFKVLAYQRAARAIDHLPKEVEIMLREGEDLRAIPGVGEAIAQKITELVNTGKLEYYEKLRAEFPPGVTSLTDIPGIGPKTAVRLSQELGVSSADELEKAIQEGRVAQLFRMGQKSAENMLHAIQALRRKDKRIPLGEALPVVEEMLSQLKTIPRVQNLTAAGSLRRFQETIGDIDLMGTADDPEAVISAFAQLPQVKEVLAQGSTKASVIVGGGLQVDLRLVEHENFGSLLQYFTGSKQHNILLRERAHRMGLKLSEYGITDLETGKTESFATEEAYYARQGLIAMPPEIREGGQEIALAEAGTLPTLVGVGDIKGDFHVHSEASDGHDSIEDIALAAKARGYEYIAITDHSVGLGVARGLNLDRLRQQVAEIKALRERLGIYIFTGMELDIRADGSLDFPDEVLREVEVVVASVHSSMLQEQEKMTARVLKALDNPYGHILGHPSCRLLGVRGPVQLDWEAVFQRAAQKEKVLEINAMPQRLDIKDIHAYRARELGVKLVISTDAHSVAHLDLINYGVGVARRGWCQPSDIINTWPLERIKAFLAKNGG